MSYRWLEHTSELALRIDAPSEKAVFEQALVALGELIGRDGDREGANDAASRRDADGELCARELTVAAGDRAALLAAFLEELVYLAETDDLVPERAERLELAGGRLTATVRGHRGSPRHVVKGVTYHELTFAPSPEGFVATVVLDV
jgi:SHS2 domain-containing protein